MIEVLQEVTDWGDAPVAKRHLSCKCIGSFSSNIMTK